MIFCVVGSYKSLEVKTVLRSTTYRFVAGLLTSDFTGSRSCLKQPTRFKCLGKKINWNQQANVWFKKPPAKIKSMYLIDLIVGFHLSYPYRACRVGVSTYPYPGWFCRMGPQFTWQTETARSLHRYPRPRLDPNIVPWRFFNVPGGKHLEISDSCFGILFYRWSYIE